MNLLADRTAAREVSSAAGSGKWLELRVTPAGLSWECAYTASALDIDHLYLADFERFAEKTRADAGKALRVVGR